MTASTRASSLVNEAIARVDPQDVNPVRHGLRYIPVQEFQRADAHGEQQNALISLNRAISNSVAVVLRTANRSSKKAEVLGPLQRKGGATLT